jgi:hypothetical protein
VQIQLMDQISNPGSGDNSPAAWIRDHEKKVHIPCRQATEMFHARFVVDHDVPVISRQKIEALPCQGVGGAVAPRSLRSPHGDEIESFGFHQGLLNLIFKPYILRHARGDVFLHQLPGLTDGGSDLHTQDLMQVRVCVGIHHQDGTLAPVEEIAEDHPRQGRLSCSSLS